jgi:uncharacterized UPF0160 family protein
MKVAEEEFMWQIRSTARVYMPARQIVEAAWKEKDQFHPSGEFLHLSVCGPWKDHLYNLEKENGKEGLIKFVFYKDDRSMVRIQTVPPTSGSFDMRVPLAAAWRGIRGKELQEVSGFADPEFVHHSGFIGGAWSLETALKMAE